MFTSLKFLICKSMLNYQVSLSQQEYNHLLSILAIKIFPIRSTVTGSSPMGVVIKKTNLHLKLSTDIKSVFTFQYLAFVAGVLEALPWSHAQHIYKAGVFVIVAKYTSVPSFISLKINFLITCSIISSC